MNKLEQAARQALEALEDGECSWNRQYKAITALREALAEQAEQEPVLWGDDKFAPHERPQKPEECANGCPPLQVCDYCQTAEQVEQEPFKMICPRCKVDRVTTQCPNRGGIGDCPMTATAQSAAPVKSICYQEAYDALEAQLIKEPTGNGLDQVAQNNGLIIAMNTLQKMNLAKQAEGAIVKTCPDGYGTITTEQAEQEPVAWGQIDQVGTIVRCVPYATTQYDKYKSMGFVVQLYAAPVRTKDLTDDEIAKAVENIIFDENFDINIARAVIAADREKNRAG